VFRNTKPVSGSRAASKKRQQGCTQSKVLTHEILGGTTTASDYKKRATISRP